MGIHASVRDHLNAFEPAPDWVVSLGEMIQRVDGCSVEGIARGWEILMMSDLASLTPLQRETIELLVLNIKNNLTDGLIQAGRLER
jgi:hypothetical protein